MKYGLLFLASCSLVSNSSNSSESNVLEDEYRTFYVYGNEEGLGTYLGKITPKENTLEETLNSGIPVVALVVLKDYAHMTLWEPYITTDNLTGLGERFCLDGFDEIFSLFPEEMQTYLGGSMPPLYTGNFTLPESFTDPTPENYLPQTPFCKFWFIKYNQPLALNETSFIKIHKEGIFYVDGSVAKQDVTGTIHWNGLGGILTLSDYAQMNGKHSPDGTEIEITFQNPFKLNNLGFISGGDNCSLEIVPNDENYYTNFTLTLVPFTEGNRCVLSIQEGAFIEENTESSSLNFQNLLLDWESRIEFTVDIVPQQNSYPLLKQPYYLTHLGNGVFQNENDEIYEPQLNVFTAALAHSRGNDFNVNSVVQNFDKIWFLADGIGSNVQEPVEEDFFFSEGWNRFLMALHPAETFTTQDVIVPVELTFLKGFMTETKEGLNGTSVIIESQETEENLFSWSRLYDMAGFNPIPISGGPGNYPYLSQIQITNILPVNIGDGFTELDIIIDGLCSVTSPVTEVLNTNKYIYEFEITFMGSCTFTLPQGFFVGIDYPVINAAYSQSFFMSD